MSDASMGGVAVPSGETDQVEALLRRLADAEGALNAIIAGQVDAVALPNATAPVLLQKAQEALRRSEERYRNLVTRSPAIVCELSPDGTTLYVNDAVTAILGYEESDLIGKKWWSVICAKLTQERQDNLWQKFRTGNVVDLEMVIMARSGERKTLVWNSTNHVGPGGMLEAIVAFGLDITERKRAEEGAYKLAAEQAARAEAESAEDRAALLAEASRVLGSSLDYENTLAQVAELVVPALGDWCAVDVMEPDATVRRIAVTQRSAGRAESAEELERRYPPVALSAEGKLEPRRIENALVVPLTMRDRSIGAITLVSARSGRRYDNFDLRVAEDLAQRMTAAIEHARLYEEARVARAEAETANKAKSEFLASMSHELRTPLNAIGGYVQLLEEGIQGPLNDQQREYLRRTKRSQQHLLGLINDVLNFAKLEAGRVQFRMSEVPLRETLAEVDDLTAPQVGAKGLAYENKACDTEIVVRVDRDKFRQIVLNLVSNAVKFTPPGGRITVECGIQGGLASVTVRDTGIGIPADKVEAVFEAFVQVGKELNREGTGLGLSISRELARAMQGDLTGESTIGAGSAFTVTVPLIAR